MKNTPLGFRVSVALTCLLAAVGAFAATPDGRIDARMIRTPDVSATQIAFVYAGDIWLVPKAGGTAVRVSSPKGEEQFPRFSPDGSLLAFSGNYDGNLDIYVMPAQGGVPKRLTFHGAADRVIGWYPDGKSILFASGRESPRDRFNQLYKISVDGGLPEKLPVPYGEFGAISPDGGTLAYTPISVDFRTWKRYRGGMNPDIWFFNFKTGEAKNVTHDDAADAQPMWHGTTMYFLSDRDAHRRANIWAYDTVKDTFRQVTTFTDFDVHFPSSGPSDMVFENAGRLYLLDLATEQYHEVDVRVVTDRATLKPRLENVSKYIRNADISPTGKRAVIEARGEVFTVPAENGVVRDLTATPGIAEREPAWSPDGKRVAYFTDRTGEYELAVRNADGSGEEQILTKLGKGFRYQPFWSPDSEKVAFIDQAMKVWVYDLTKKKAVFVTQEMWMYNDELMAFSVSWSADSRWMALGGDQGNEQSSILLYDCKNAKLHQVISPYYSADQPVFDPDGKYLYFRSGRAFEPVYSDLDNTWVYPNSQRLMAVPLRKDVASPLTAKNDEEPVSGSKTNATAKAEKKEKEGDDKDADKPKAKTAKAVDIDLEGFEGRAVVLPPRAGRYSGLAAVSGKLIYLRQPRNGMNDEKSSAVYYDLEKREEKTIVEEADWFRVSANGQKMLVRRKADYFIVETKAGQKPDKKLATDRLEMVVDPAAEWRQIFNDVWRLQRDYFYDPGMHGVDWEAMRVRYGKLMDDAVTRWDVNYILGELIAEINSSHTYRGGGDMEQAPVRGVGYLGCDFTLENGAYRIHHIVNGASWDAEVRSPLLQAGSDVKEGDYLLAVNGRPLDIHEEPWAALQGLANQTVQLTVNGKPELKGARQVVVQTLESEARLRYLAWVEENRLRVDKASGGKIGYVYVPDTAVGGQSELVRQYRAQIDKAGLVIDERFNSGGQIPDRFVEMLNRPVKNYWGVRDGKDWVWPTAAQQGPKAMLMNGWSGSGGDGFPFYFKQAGLGPLIGMRTWGGLIGITGAPTLVDGGYTTVPTFGIYGTNGQWIIEGHGVDPDIEVIDDPAAMAKGGDPQLERAILEVQKALQQAPPQMVPKPPYPKRAN